MAKLVSKAVRRQAPDSRSVPLRPLRVGAAKPALVRPSDFLIGKTRANDVWHRLREDILSGMLLPSEQLRFEKLRTVYDVSFATIREALARLASEGLVVADAQRGFSVAPVSVANLLDLAQLRVMIESDALRRSIENGGDEWKSAVLAAFHKMDRLGADPTITQTWITCHRDFHLSLIAACDSPLMLNLCAQLFDKAGRYRRISKTHRTYSRDKSGEHREIMEASISGDAEAACKLLSDHFWDTTNNVIAAMNVQAEAAQVA